MAVSQWGFSKGFGAFVVSRIGKNAANTVVLDNTNPLGPCLVSAAAIPDPQKVLLKCTVNGNVVQDGTTAFVPLLPTSYSLLIRSYFTTSEQIFNVRQTIAFLSQATTLQPGSIILTGTPKGVGFVKKPPACLKDGDKMSVWVGGGIGTLVNDVQEEKSDPTILSRL
jgi:2-keto-4-pentenoate hydratase/2-oxohepta-3-ene-1,7-dioic acid hydratase in catechol pathway